MDKIKVNIDNFIRANLIADYPEMSNQRLSRFWEKKGGYPSENVVPMGFSIVFCGSANRPHHQDWRNL